VDSRALDDPEKPGAVMHQQFHAFSHSLDPKPTFVPVKTGRSRISENHDHTHRDFESVNASPPIDQWGARTSPLRRVADGQ
jgi:hypothetical protein